MSTLKIRGERNSVKGKLKQKYAYLAGDDLDYVDGEKDELVGRIQKRTGESKDDDNALDECDGHGF